MSSRNPNTDPDPWSRPQLADLQAFAAEHEPSDPGSRTYRRSAERLELSVPAEITTSRGSVVPALTRDISRFGIGLLFRGMIQPGEITVKMASDTREYRYKVELLWCQHFKNGLFAAGGKFLSRVDDDMPGS